jgi:predicted nucleic acid-binding protein
MGHYVSLEDRHKFFRLCVRLAEWVPIISTVQVRRDPKDDKFLDLAVDGEAGSHL